MFQIEKAQRYEKQILVEKRKKRVFELSTKNWNKRLKKGFVIFVFFDREFIFCWKNLPRHLEAAEIVILMADMS